jgi:hypothetical protein
LTLALALSSAHFARAEPTPLSKIICSNVELAPVLETQTLSLISWSSMGIGRDQSDRGEPDASERCIGTTLTHGGRRIVHGYCLTMNPNGDQVLAEVSRDGEDPGTWRLIDGTGEAAGITGDGTYRLITEARPIQEGTWQFCNQVEGSYTVKE